VHGFSKSQQTQQAEKQTPDSFSNSMNRTTFRFPWFHAWYTQKAHSFHIGSRETSYAIN